MVDNSFNYSLHQDFCHILVEECDHVSQYHSLNIRTNAALHHEMVFPKCPGCVRFAGSCVRGLGGSSHVRRRGRIGVSRQWRNLNMIISCE